MLETTHKMLIINSLCTLKKKNNTYFDQIRYIRLDKFAYYASIFKELNEKIHFDFFQNYCFVHINDLVPVNCEYFCTLDRLDF